MPAWAAVSGIFLLLLQIAGGSLRTGSIFVFLRRPRRLSTITRINFVGAFYSQTLVSFLGGDGMRIWQFTRRGIPVKDATYGILLDRLAGLVAQLLVMTLTLPLVFQLVDGWPKRLVLIALIAASLGGLFALFSMRYVPIVARTRFRMINILFELSVNTWKLVSDWRNFTIVFTLSIIITVINSFIIYIFFFSLNINIGLYYVIILTPSVFFLSMMPVSFAGWGVREGAMAAAFAVLHIPVDQSILVSVAFGVLSFLVSLPGSVLLFSPRDREFRERRMRKAASRGVIGPMKD